MTETQRPDGYDALPKRFKDYIRQMEGELHSARASQLVSTPTRVKIADYSARHDDKPEVYLPDRTRLAFRVGRSSWAWIEVRHTDQAPDAIEVSSSRGLVVYPGVSNVVYVGLRKD